MQIVFLKALAGIELKSKGQHSCQNQPAVANGSGRICLLAILDSFNNLLGINLVALKRADWGMFRQAP